MMKANENLKQIMIPDAPPENSIINILLIEDDKLNRFLNSKILSRIGYHIELAGDSHEALSWLHKKHFDAILMDIRLPGMDGIELTRFIRSQGLPYSDIPIFALTSSTVLSVRQHAFEAGMNEYLTKPYNTSELQHLIQKYTKK